MEESGQDRKWNCVTVLHVDKNQLIGSKTESGQDRKGNCVTVLHVGKNQLIDRPRGGSGNG